MYLTGRQIQLMAHIMQTLAESHEEAEIRRIVGDLVMQLLQAQFYASFVWQPDMRVFARPIQINMDPANIGRYESYFQFHDPITPLMQRYQVAVRATGVLPMGELRKTEFFNDFLGRDGLHWGVNLYAWHQGRNLGDMRIWRDSRREDFSDDDLRMLDMIQPAFVSALARVHQPAAGSAMDRSVLSALSPREREITMLIAQGLSDKAIARQLGISAATVRTHLEHAFKKTGSINRAALVHQALG